MPIAMLMTMTSLAAQRQAFAGASLAQRPCSTGISRARCVITRAKLELKPLPYEMTALEPNISKETLEFHWGKHHQTYVTNLNGQLDGKDLINKPLEEIVMATYNGGNTTPEFNNAGQIWNHDFYWQSLSPKPTEPSAELMAAIKEAFGSFEELKGALCKAGATQFGSGWAWLVKDKSGKLAVTKTLNAENPLVHGETPLLTVDVWEHAYYIDYRNARPKYLSTIVEEMLNWEFASKNFAA